ncbi:hypothetical protein MRX96_046312 [Rhipicephalus microplus]
MAGVPKMAAAAVCFLATWRFFGMKFFTLRARSLEPALLAVCFGDLDSRLVAALSFSALVRALEAGEGRGGFGRPAKLVCKTCAAVFSSRSQALALSAKSRT